MAISTSFFRYRATLFRNPKVVYRRRVALHKTPTPSEGVRIHQDSSHHYPVEVFGDHGFCAGHSTRVYAMNGPHMHSQVEFNYISSGSMTYWFDGRELTVGAGELVLFWGMIPHQVTHCGNPTDFVVIYAPMSLFIELPELGPLRDAIFRGAMVAADAVRPFEGEIFLKWRKDLMGGERRLEQIVRDELTARVRRIDVEGWKDLRSESAYMPDHEASGTDHDRALRVEMMARFINEHALENISAEDVAKAARLHPNYAMALFKRTVGMTIKQSIIRHRMDTAQSMLIGSDTSISQTAFDCGFGSISSFYAAFEKRFGVSPQHFRKSIRSHQEEMAARG
jgi:AraC family transcriptional regulator, melibiose operon regulatory protein